MRPPLVLWQTLRQITLAELNRMGYLAGRAVQDLLLDIGAGLDSDSSGGTSFTRRGLDAGVPSGLQPRVLAGSFVMYDASALTDTSSYRLGQLDADTLAPAVTPDGALPRIARISAAPLQVDGSSTVRNILRLPSRVAEPISFNLARSPGADLVTTMGVAATNPVPPATPAGRVALWDVYVPAAAVSLTQNQSIDLRAALRPHGDVAANGARGRGLVLARGTGLLALQLSGGEAVVRGAVREFNGAITRDGAAVDLTPPGSPAFTAGQLWYAYLVVSGGGTGVARGVASRAVIALSQVAPSSTGVPSSPISYNPLQGLLSFAAGAPLYSTSRALYVGSVRVLTGPEFRVEGVPLDREGAFVNRTLDAASGGLFGGPHGWIRRPRFTWVDEDTVEVEFGAPTHRGVPGYFRSLSATVSGSLILGAVEAPSVFYYAYVRRRLTSRQEYDLVLSTQAPNDEGELPTPEGGGYVASDYVYVGAIYNDSASDLARFSRTGMRTLWTDRASLYGPATVPPPPPAVDQVQARAPATADFAVIVANVDFAVTLSAGAWTRRLFILAGEGLGQTTAEVFGHGSSPSNSENGSGNLALDIQLGPSGRFELSATAAGASPEVQVRTSIMQVGFIEYI